MNKVVIVASHASYRTGDYLAAASLLRVHAVVASDAPPPLGEEAAQIRIDLTDAERAARRIARLVPDAGAVVAIDDQGVAAANLAAGELGLDGNPAAGVAATTDKAAMRAMLSEAGVPQPDFRLASPGGAVAAAGEIGYPCVVKPTGLSASRGVIRVDDPAAAARAEARVRAILVAAGCSADEALLVEEFVQGFEVAVEGVLHDGDLEVLAIIDKPGGLEGPFFEETLYTTPSRHPESAQQAAVRTVAQAVDGLGLRRGPVHGEVRIRPDGSPVLIEVAARSIGGLCGRALTFGLLGESLEVLVLRSALGLRVPDATPARPATGVLMIPIPATGVLTEIEGLEEVRALSGIDDITITIPVGRRVEALPEGDRYLGFVFAVGESPASVETTLRNAGSLLVAAVDGEAVRPAVSAPGSGGGPPNC